MTLTPEMVAMGLPDFWDLDDLAPGVVGKVERGPGLMVLVVVFATQQGRGDVSRYLDSLPTDVTVQVPIVVSPKLRGMLARRGFVYHPWETYGNAHPCRRCCTHDGSPEGAVSPYREVEPDPPQFQPYWCPNHRAWFTRANEDYPRSRLSLERGACDHTGETKLVPSGDLEAAVLTPSENMRKAAMNAFYRPQGTFHFPQDRTEWAGLHLAWDRALTAALAEAHKLHVEETGGGTGFALDRAGKEE